jgi:hypothetical protein
LGLTHSAICDPEWGGETVSIVMAMLVTAAHDFGLRQGRGCPGQARHDGNAIQTDSPWGILSVFCGFLGTI